MDAFDTNPISGSNIHQVPAPIGLSVDDEMVETEGIAPVLAEDTFDEAALRSKAQELILSALNRNNNTALQSEFASTVSEQVKKLSLEAWQKRVQESTVDLTDSNSDFGDNHNAKRPRLEEPSDISDDNFIDDLLTNEGDPFNFESLTDETLAGEQTNSGQDMSNELQLQKEALLGWFSECLFQVEVSLQGLLEGQSKAHQSQAALLKRQHADEMKRVHNPNTVQLDDIDTERIQLCDNRYQAVQQERREALARHDFVRLGQLEIESRKKYENLKHAMKDEVMLMKCRHFNERSVDRAKIAELEGTCKTLTEEVHAQVLESRQLKARVGDFERQTATGVNPFAAEIVNLRVAYSELQKVNAQQQIEITALKHRGGSQALQELEQLKRSFQEQGAELSSLRRQTVHGLQGVSEVEKMKMQVNMLTSTNLKQTKEIEGLKFQAQELRKGYLDSLNQNKTLLEKNQMLHRITASTATNVATLQAQMGRMQQTANLGNQPLAQAQMLQSDYSNAIQKQEEAHKEELRKILNNHRGQMKGQKIRMENLAQKIVVLTNKSREKSDELHHMAEEVNTLKSQNEALLASIAKLRRESAAVTQGRHGSA